MEQLKQKLKQAEEFENSGKLLHALQIYRSLADDEEINSPLPVIKLAQLYEKLGRAEVSIKTLEEFLKENPDDKKARRFFLQFLVKQKQYQKAIDVANLLSKEDDPSIYTLVGLAYYYLEDYEMAKVNFEAYLTSKDKNLLAEAYFYIASCNFKMAKLDEALKYIKKSEVLFSLNPELYIVKGMTYYAQKLYYHAYDAFRKAELLDRRNMLIKEMKSKTLVELGEFEKAEKIIKELIENSSPNYEYYSLLGKINLKKKNKKEAKGYFEKALEINPHDDESIKGLQESTEE
jgi:tetratricopeptide (TPR) repeat protein